MSNLRCYLSGHGKFLSAALALGALMTLGAAVASATTEKVLHNFTYIPDGAYPNGNLLFDSAGNIYGTTEGGGFNCQGSGCGTAFELSPDGNGGWNETILHAFTGGLDGVQPSSGLIADAAGNLFGVTATGGQMFGVGSGVVYELSPNGSGEWTEKVIHTFSGLQGGGEPFGNLVFDSAGNLYGTTSAGGAGSGVAFKLSPDGQGGWNETTIFQFGSYRGAGPTGSLIFDSSGNLYGTAVLGGIGYGVVFELMPRASGAWAERVLYSFTGAQDGSEPSPGLLLDSSGNIYGETGLGGLAGYGTIFELVHASKNSWKVKTLHNFGGTSGGRYPGGGLIFDSSGNLYGTADTGGSLGCFLRGCGIAFELSPNAGHWSETVINDFSADLDGGYPNGAMIFDTQGNLYGATIGSTTTFAQYGAIFELVP
jgi:hypothetical protein